MVEKLVVVVMGQDGERFLNMSLPAIRDADAVVLCDGGSVDNTLDICKAQGVQHIIHQKYDQKDLGANGRQRQFFLDYLKQNFSDWWCLAIDFDEVVSDINELKKVIQIAKPGVYSVHMRHLIQTLAEEDNTTQRHYVLNRFFKVSEAEKYDFVEHPILRPKEGTYKGTIDEITIWHLSYVPNLFELKKKYDNHLKKSNIHTPEYLKNWYWQHLFGTYPKKRFDPVELPEVILNYFGIDKDEIYFQSRGIEMKNVVMVRQWNEFFKPQSLLDLGCGRGPYLYFWEMLVPGKVEGYELSQWAVEHAFTDKVKQKDISEDWNLEFPTGKQGNEIVQLASVDLVCAVDVLEHLPNEQLNRTLKNMYKYGNKFLFSIPFIGDPNLTNDKTHLQHRTKEGWIKLLEGHGFKISDPPAHWLFKEQILIGTK